MTTAATYGMETSAFFWITGLSIGVHSLKPIRSSAHGSVMRYFPATLSFLLKSRGKSEQLALAKRVGLFSSLSEIAPYTVSNVKGRFGETKPRFGNREKGHYVTQ